jgi:DMSO/TMAO reductase YedYZ molybdopterin-dependent catalytic subunit
VIEGGLAAFLAACKAGSTPVETGTAAVPTDTTGAVFEGLASFVGEEARSLDELTGAGLDGRLVTDLSAIDADSLVTETERFYVRTAASDLLDPAGWSVAVNGRVSAPIALELADIEALAVPQGVLQFECSGNTSTGGFGLMSAADWEGAQIADILALVDVDPGVGYVRITGFDTYPDSSSTSVAGAAWVYLRSDLEGAGAFLATRMNDAELPANHGYPVRLIVPGWYGCCNIKWVKEIALVDESEPATSQMLEFASRTQQSGTPRVAAHYLPAVNDVAATVVRVEKWRREDGSVFYRAIGVTWGGPNPVNTLHLQLGAVSRTVAVSPERLDGRGWSIWEAAWEPAETGDHVISLSVDDPAIRTRRLDSGYYARTVAIDEV